MDQPSLDDDDTVTWVDPQVAALRSLATRPALSNMLDGKRLWTNAGKIADASLNVFGDRLLGEPPDLMPFTPEEMSSDGFDMDRALERLAEVLKARSDHH